MPFAPGGATRCLGAIPRAGRGTEGPSGSSENGRVLGPGPGHCQTPQDGQCCGKQAKTGGTAMTNLSRRTLLAGAAALPAASALAQAPAPAPATPVLATPP